MTRIQAEKSTYLSYAEASQYAQDNNITCAREWRAMAKHRPKNVPCHPDQMYKEWQGWPQFCNTERRSKDFVWATYEECQNWALSNNIESVEEWRALKQNRPQNMPAAPDRSYKDVWPGWSKFLENGNRSPGQWGTYEECKTWARTNNIMSRQQWLNNSHLRPIGIPSNPKDVYKDVWPGWSKFLNNGIKLRNHDWITYEEASMWAQEQKIIGTMEWNNSCRPNNIPFSPEAVYKKQWKGWGVFLNSKKLVGVSKTERIMRLIIDSVLDPTAEDHRKQYIMGASKKQSVDMAYPQIKLIVEYDGVFYHKNKQEKDIEKTKDLTQKGWTVVRVRESGLDILDNTLNVEVVFNEVIENKIKKVLQHLIALSKSQKIKVTKEQCKGLQILNQKLDIKKFIDKMNKFSAYLPYEEASEWAKDNQIKTCKQWSALKERRPSNLPACPDNYYKTQGVWSGWPNFLGTTKSKKKA